MIANEPIENYKTGFVSIYRSIKKHWIWDDAVKFKWWIDILLTVNFEDKKVNIGYDIFECKRGQSIQSLQTWAKSWNVSKDTARNFLQLLKKDNMILLENLKKTTRLTVLNYDSYQIVLHDKQTQSKRKANDKQTQAHPNNNDNNYNNDNKEYFSDVDLNNLFLEHLKIRKKIGAINSDLAIEKLIKKLRQLSNNKKESAILIIENAITNSWKSYFPLKN